MNSSHISHLSHISQEITSDSITRDNINFLMLAVYTFMMPIMCFFIRIPYGKFAIERWWLPLISNKHAFAIMEMPNLIVVSTCLAVKGIPHFINGMIMMCFFLYAFNRAVIYPNSIVRIKKNWPVQLVLLGALFTTINSLNQVAVFYGNYSFWSINVFLGFFIWVYSFCETMYADQQLLYIASINDGYVLPYGRWFGLISSPHYLFEIVMWFGYFMMSMSYESFLFLMATIFNVLPRALDTHRYYQERFGPLETHAIIPFVW